MSNMKTVCFIFHYQGHWGIYLVVSKARGFSLINSLFKGKMTTKQTQCLLKKAYKVYKMYTLLAPDFLRVEN